LARAGWDAPVIVNSKAVDEIIFWKENTAIYEWQRFEYY
jgi:hypothetical protein